MHGLRNRTVTTYTPVRRANSGPPPLPDAPAGHRARTHPNLVPGKNIGRSAKAGAKRLLKRQVKKTCYRAERCIRWVMANGECLYLHGVHPVVISYCCLSCYQMRELVLGGVRATSCIRRRGRTPRVVASGIARRVGAVRVRTMARSEWRAFAGGGCGTSGSQRKRRDGHHTRWNSGESTAAICDAYHDVTFLSMQPHLLRAWHLDMQTLFHDRTQNFPLSKEGHRHPEDVINPLILYYMADTGEEFAERKGIRHDFEHWGERGNPQVMLLLYLEQMSKLLTHNRNPIAPPVI